MALKFNLMFPMRAVKHYREWIGDGSLGEVAKCCEEAGFDGFSMSEHPYPDREWLARGGHHAFDPFVSLAVAAEATSRIRLLTYAMVVGYRSPYLGAKAVASLDLLSGGRVTLGLGAGYLETEFDALRASAAGASSSTRPSMPCGRPGVVRSTRVRRTARRDTSPCHYHKPTVVRRSGSGETAAPLGDG